MSVKDIDPALGLLAEFGKVANGIAGHIHEMRQVSIFKDGAVEAKHKILGSVLWSISARCEPCIKFYVQKALQCGVTEPEIGEYLGLAATMGGCVGEMWALKAYQAFKVPNGGDEDDQDGPSCCQG